MQKPTNLGVFGAATAPRLVVACAVAAGVALALAACAHGSDVKVAKPNWVVIPAGSFHMGAVTWTIHGDELHEDGHEVTITRPYQMMATEVTVDMFREYAKASGNPVPSQPDWSTGHHPVVNVTWAEARSYCQWTGGRLPTDEEWEYAARAGRFYNYPWSDTSLPMVSGRPAANVADDSRTRGAGDAEPAHFNGYSDGFVNAAPVGSFVANPFGLFDLGGNVQEWCAEEVDPQAPGAALSHADRSIMSSLRVARGGSYQSALPRQVRNAHSGAWLDSSTRYVDVGLRCVKDR
jgi:formylglycine-generating enzyme required for sulfatase activity